jgi:hypothetical protein
MSGVATDTSAHARRRGSLVPALPRSTVRRYLATQYPPAQAVAVGVAVVTSYAAYGRIAGGMSIDAPALVAAVTVMVLFLQLRVVDDVTVWSNTHDRDEVSGATGAALVAGLVATTVGIAIVNAAIDARMLAATVAITLVMAATLPATTRERRLPPPVSVIFGRLPLFELCPAAMLAYAYLAWHVSSGRSLRWFEVAVVVGVLLCGFSVWKFTRHLGERTEERIYRMPWPVVRVLCMALLAASLALNALLVSYAELSPAFLAWVAGVTAVFAFLARPRRSPDTERPAWAGLPYPTAIVAGLAIELLAHGW